MNTQDQDHPDDNSAHFFLNFLNKKARNLNKKIREIETLEALKDIKPEQQKKIEGKHVYQSQLKELNDIRNLFLQAEKETGKGKIESKRKPSGSTLKHQDKHPVIKPTLNLIHLCQIYNTPQNKEEMKKHAANPQDLDIFTEFSQNLFGLNKACQSHSKYNVYLNHCYHQLDKYLNASEDIAIQNLSFRYILENVEKYVNSAYFHDLASLPVPVVAHLDIPPLTQEKPVQPQPENQHVEPEAIFVAKSPEKSPVKVFANEPAHLNQPESPNQMLMEEEKTHETQEKIQNEEYGVEGKFEEDHHDEKNKRGGHGGNHNKRGGRGYYKGGQHKKRYNDYENNGYYENERHYEHEGRYENKGNHEHEEEHPKQQVEENDGFITVKHKQKKEEGREKSHYRGRGAPRGNRGSDRSFAKTAGEREHHEREHHEREHHEREHHEKDYREKDHYEGEHHEREHHEREHHEKDYREKEHYEGEHHERENESSHHQKKANFHRGSRGGKVGGFKKEYVQYVKKE